MAPGLIIRREEGQAEFSGDYHLSQSSPTREVPNGHRHENGHVDDFELLQPDKMDPIAVVGLALRFPQDASSPEAFWQMLLEGRSALTDVPKDRYHVDAFYKASATKSGTMNARGGHFLKDDIAAFDAPFFSITPMEAECMDPQQRLLLETTYQALENAGIPLDQALGSNTSVYVGSFVNDYAGILTRDPELPIKYKATGTGNSMLANRLSWFYNLRGPSVTLDTACSSSLNALHLAAQSLRTKESSMGIVCGCNLIFNPDISISLADMNFLSPDSKCYSFDSRANGYSRGEGFGVVIIKPLAKAIEDGDTIRAVIRATASNQDGRTSGITQPSDDAQEQLIRKAYIDGGLDMERTRYFEAHGTGTSLGDPIEAHAIYSAFKNSRPPGEPLYIGGVKSNIGHLEGASGLAGLIKSIFVLESGIIPPNIWFERVNPKIPSKEWGLHFPLENTAWPMVGLRRVSVNSFGFGGSNAHAVLDDAYHYLQARGLKGRHTTQAHPSVRPIGFADRLTASILTNGVGHDLAMKSKDGCLPKVLVWSASDENGIRRLASVYEAHLSKIITCPEGYLDELAYTLSEKRSRLTWRSYAIATSLEQLKFSLKQGLPSPSRSLTQPRLCFVFTGQGAQWFGMGRKLLRYRVFQKSLEDAGIYLQNLGCPWHLMDEFIKQNEGKSNLNDPAYVQPICTALQIALVELLSSWDVRPSVIVGHSSGEIAAAYCTGAITRESAWKIAYYRGYVAALAQKSTREPGGMMSVGLSCVDVEPYLLETNENLSSVTGSVSVACVNSPRNVTLAGSDRKLGLLQAKLDRDEVFARKLKVDIAYHTSYMDDFASTYRSLIHGVGPSKPSFIQAGNSKMVSTVTGKEICAGSLTEDYWVSNLVSTVRFSDAIAHICDQSPQRTKLDRELQEGVSVDHFLEIGPHSTLRGPLMETVKSLKTAKQIGYFSMLRRGEDAIATALEAAAGLHCAGYEVNLAKVNNSGGKLLQPSMLTNLPAYPFNHENKYWLESRMSKSYRFRQFPHHELLGTRVEDWNPLEARWRNRIILSEKPWLKDHAVNGTEVYPAAGMLVMAIEAARQLADPAKARTGYRLRDVAFHKALVLSSGPEGVETQFYLRPAKEIGNKLALWNEFRLCTYENGEWTENCRGAVSIEHRESMGLDDNTEAEDELHYYSQEYERGAEKCQMTLSSKQFYEVLNESGLNYGPTFQTVRQVRFTDEGHATAAIDTRDWMGKVADKSIQPHRIHPTALDGVLQIAYPALTKGGKDAIPVMVPTKLQNLWISEINNGQPENSTINVHAKTAFQGIRSATASIVAVAAADGSPYIVGDFEMTFVGGSGTFSTAKLSRQLRCYHLDWKPDVDLLESGDIGALCATTAAIPNSFAELAIQEKELWCYLSILKTINELGQGFSTTSSHLQKYYAWMENRLSSRTGQSISIWSSTTYPIENEADLQALQNKVENSGPEGKILVKIAKNLAPIFRGEVDPLELLFEDSLLEDYYSDAHNAQYMFQKAKKYVEVIAHKNPALKVLEIGAGTGSATRHVVDVLMHQEEPVDGSCATPRFSEYVYTDISPSFFERAKEKFPNHRMTFSPLNIEKDPLQQGFEIEAYDVVIAANVLHATADLQNTLCNTRKLLKPGGKLVLFEGVNPEILRLGFIFGLLPGWWLSVEGSRNLGPLITRNEWHARLSESQFSGVDDYILDHEEEKYQTCNVMISTAAEATKTPQIMPEIAIITNEMSPVQERIVSCLLPQVNLLASRCKVISLHDLASSDVTGAMCIFLAEIDESFLYNIGNERFKSLKEIFNSAQGVLWLTSQRRKCLDNPTSEMVMGLSRCIRTEVDGFKFVTLSLEDLQRTTLIVKHIIKILKATVFSPMDYEPEYQEKDGVLCISRIDEMMDLTKRGFLPPNSDTTLQKFGQSEESGRPLEMTIGSIGLLDTLTFTDDFQHQQPLGADEIELKIKAVGLNFRDVLVALGQIPCSTFGNECSGVITRVGAAVSRNLAVGDRVVCGVNGAYKTYGRCVATSASKVPSHMSFAAAAAIPVAFCTAYYSLMHWARLKQGESILIHSGAGGFGQALIQIAKIMNAEIYVTVGTREKRKLLMDLYGIPEDHFFSSRSLTFAKALMRKTKGRGVDVIVNSLAGEGLRASWECIAAYGRFIETGKKDIYASGVSALGGLSMIPFARNVMFASVDLAFIFDTNKALLGELMSTVMTLAEEKKIVAPQPLQVFNASHIEQAFRFMQSGKHTGKLIIEFHTDDMVPVSLRSQPTYEFDRESSYLIAGGLGGIGRSIARWMVGKKARNFILLGRSDPSKYGKETTAFLKDLRARGVHVATPPCDVSDSSSLASALLECSKTMPPIRGCFQASMVLENQMFKNMTLTEFEHAIKPKVQGTWNLHTLLPQNMDFFVMLSSYAGIIGAVGQSNYCCGNTYQDGLAKHRLEHGEKAISIDLNVMESVGYVFEHQHISNHLQSIGLDGLRESELYFILEYYCNPSLPLQAPTQNQVVVNIELPTFFRAKNLPEHPWLSRPLFRLLHQIEFTGTTRAPSDQDKTENYSTLLQAVKSLTEAVEVVIDALRAKVAKILSLEKDDVDPDKTLDAYGVDSLVAVEIGIWFKTTMEATVPIFEILGKNSMRSLAKLVVENSAVVPDRFEEVEGGTSREVRE